MFLNVLVDRETYNALFPDLYFAPSMVCVVMLASTVPDIETQYDCSFWTLKQSAKRLSVGEHSAMFLVLESIYCVSSPSDESEICCEAHPLNENIDSEKIAEIISIKIKMLDLFFIFQIIQTLTNEEIITYFKTLVHTMVIRQIF